MQEKRSISSQNNAALGQYHTWLLIVLLVAVFGAFLVLAFAFYKRGIPSGTPHMGAEGKPTSVNFRHNAETPTNSPYLTTRGEPLPEKFELQDSIWVPQTYNNCAPATVSMVLQQFGYSASQADIKKVLRTNPDDRNVFAYEVSDYLKTNYGIESKLLYNGDVGKLKQLIANEIYVIVEYWLHPNEDIGHLGIVRGYDDTGAVLILDDSFVGAGIKINYQEFDETQWKAFNRTYLPVYEKSKEELVRSIIGSDWNEKNMFQSAIQRNLADVQANQQDLYAWFNLGAGYFALGQYQDAKQAFETSQKLGWPKRMLWYQIQPVQNYNALGEYEKALALTGQGLNNNGAYAELHYEAAVAYKGLGQLEQARQEAVEALRYDAKFAKFVYELSE